MIIFVRRYGGSRNEQLCVGILAPYCRWRDLQKERLGDEVLYYLVHMLNLSTRRTIERLWERSEAITFECNCGSTLFSLEIPEKGGTIRSHRSVIYPRQSYTLRCSACKWPYEVLAQAMPGHLGVGLVQQQPPIRLNQGDMK